MLSKFTHLLFLGVVVLLVQFHTGFADPGPHPHPKPHADPGPLPDPNPIADPGPLPDPNPIPDPDPLPDPGPLADPDPDPEAKDGHRYGKRRNNFKSRFSIDDISPLISTPPLSDTGVKILEGLSKTRTSSLKSKILKSNPAPTSSLASLSPSDSLIPSNENSLFEDADANSYDAPPSPLPESTPIVPSPIRSNPRLQPVFTPSPSDNRVQDRSSTVIVPAAPPIYNFPKPGSNKYANKPGPPPNYVGYSKPETGPTGPMIIFPPETISPSPSIFPTESPILIPGPDMEQITTPMIPPPTEGLRPPPTLPIGPGGSATEVPIITGPDLSVPEDMEDIFPPSPPQIDSLRARSRFENGRSMSVLRSSSPRTRITAVSPAIPKPATITTSIRESVVQRPELVRTSPSITPGSGGLRGSAGGRARLRDRVRESLEAASIEDNLAFDDIRSTSADPNIITDFVFSDIRCFKTRSNEYFGAKIHMKSGYHTPYVRDRPQDPLTSNDCRMETIPGTKDTFEMSVTDLRGCGVEACGDYMCLTMVFPRVPTLALADDEVTTIKCLPQKSIMSDQRTISFAGDSMDNRRSSSTVEGGGQEFAAEVGVFRQSPGAGNGLFAKRVNSGGVVQLGEPLQLRSIVRGGDGWMASRLSDVKVWRMRDARSGSLENLDTNDASEVITLVDGQGCRNGEYEVIAEKHPLKDPRNELINHFTFKAFLFRGQRVNEPLVLTAKVHACQDDVDCLIKDCSTRLKRSPVELHNSSSIIHDWDSSLAIRVIGINDHLASLTEDDFISASSTQAEGRSLGGSGQPMTCAEKMAASGLGGGLITLFLASLTLAIYAFVIRGRASRSKGQAVNQTTIGKYPSTLSRLNYSPDAGALAGPTVSFVTTPTKKPLPPPPSQQPASVHIEQEKLSKSEISNVAKLLRQIASVNEDEARTLDLEGGRGGERSARDYESIEERSSGDRTPDEYVLYYCKDKPKSAPSSLRGKGSKSSKKKRFYEITRRSETPVDCSEESSEDCGPTSRNVPIARPRTTVRDVKSRSYHSKQAKGLIRRRLSSFYSSGKDLRISNLRENIQVKNHPQGINSKNKNAGQGKGSWSKRSKNRDDNSDGIYSSPISGSDLDSAYFGSEFNNYGGTSTSNNAGSIVNSEDVLYKLRNGLHQANGNSGKRQGIYLDGAAHAVPDYGGNSMLTNVQRQIRQLHLADNYGGGKGQGVPVGPGSPPLQPGQTKAAHFVTRNESSTQILIVPETHV